VAQNPKIPDAMHFRSLALENVRAFAGQQCLNLVDETGSVSRWNLILGENGVGKTTLMQALAVMRPVPAFAEGQASNTTDTEEPPLARAELSAHENHEILRFVRRGQTSTTSMSAVLETPDRTVIDVGVTIEVGGKEGPNDFKDVKFHAADYALKANGPLVIAYGAGRHIGHKNLSTLGERGDIGSLFLDAADMYDAEEIFEELFLAAETDSRDGPDRRRLDKLKSAVASLLPGATANDIEYKVPRISDRLPGQAGVRIRTPSGMMPLEDLSLGYQSVFAWTVDLAWRLFNAYPDSDNALSESAIVLIDEVDLHLHPQWQRELRRHLLIHFPKVQFIATTHSPITAQEALSEGGSISVARWEDGEARILDNPLPRREWRYDQLVTSELFDLGSARSVDAQQRLEERRDLLRIRNRSEHEQRRLRELDEFVASLPTSSTPIEQQLEDLMRGFTRDFPGGAPR